MAENYKLSLTAEEIDQRLANALLATEQTLTPEQQTQARENIGAGSKPVVIDLDHYGAEGATIADAITALILQGGGQTQVEVGSLFTDIPADRPIHVRFLYGGVMPVTVGGATVFWQDDMQPITLSLFAIADLTKVVGVAVIIHNNGVMDVRMQSFT